MMDFDLDIDAAFGNAEAFNEIRKAFEHGHGKLYQVAFSILNDPEVALDCVQDCFMKALSAPEKFAGKSAWATYLHRMVTNKSLDILRSGKHKMSSVRSKDSSDSNVEREWTTHDVVPRGFPTPLEALLTKERMLGTQATLNGIPAAQAQALLDAVTGCSMREIAASQGIPLGTALSRINAARQALRN